MRYIVYGQESGELGTFDTFAAAKNAIREANRFDMQNVGEIDTYTIKGEGGISNDDITIRYIKLCDNRSIEQDRKV